MKNWIISYSEITQLEQMDAVVNSTIKEDLNILKMNNSLFLIIKKCYQNGFFYSQLKILN